MNKNIYVIYGGVSAEHEISLKSGYAVLHHLDSGKYNIYPVYIDPCGRWQCLGKMEQAPGSVEAMVVEPIDPTPSESLGRFLKEDFIPGESLFFPIVHGTMGEDGTMQGLFELLGAPYVGSGVLSSALCMDKGYANDLLKRYEISQARYVTLLREDFRGNRERAAHEVESRLPYPVFVKPANAGSSVGVSPASHRKELLAALEKAFLYDRRVVVEESVEGEELQISVYGNEEVTASLPGVYHVSGREFLDYDGKYLDPSTEPLVPYPLEESDLTRARDLAEYVYQIFGCRGIARVDIFITPEGELKVNEVNTLPGMTATSMVPKLWKVSRGLSYGDLLEELIELALLEAEERKNMKRSRQPS